MPGKCTADIWSWTKYLNAFCLKEQANGFNHQILTWNESGTVNLMVTARLSVSLASRGDCLAGKGSERLIWHAPLPHFPWGTPNDYGTSCQATSPWSDSETPARTWVWSGTWSGTCGRQNVSETCWSGNETSQSGIGTCRRETLSGIFFWTWIASCSGTWTCRKQINWITAMSLFG